jgi:hypothetical protein
MNLPDHDLILRVQQRGETNEVTAMLRAYCAAAHRLKEMIDLLDGYARGKLNAIQICETIRRDIVSS